MTRSPRQRLIGIGPAQLKDTELVAVLLQGGSTAWREALGQAEALLASFPGRLVGVGKAVERSAEPLPASMRHSRTQMRRVAMLRASVELGLRVLAATAEAHLPLIDTPTRIARYVNEQSPLPDAAGLLGLDEHQRLRSTELLPPATDAKASLFALYHRNVREVVLWRWRDTKPEVRNEDRSQTAFLLEGCHWLGLRLRSLVLGPGGAWAMVTGEE